MLDIYDDYKDMQKRHHNKAWISLSGKLETMTGAYYVYEEGVDPEWHWLSIYHDASITRFEEAVKLIPENLVAYISSDYRLGFVLNRYQQKMIEDTEEYGITYITVDSFDDELLCCSHTELLPVQFSDIIWINDDFMNDECIPFDYDRFMLIDDGIDYLNPHHFSVKQFVKSINQKAYKK